MNFGAYDPVAANATAPLDGIGTVTVTCTKGAAAKVGLNPGSNAQGTTRRMSQGAAAYLTYELYKDASHATVWGDTIDTALDIPAAPNRNPRDFTVYGRVAAGTRRHGRQLHRYRRGDGELLRGREIMRRQLIPAVVVVLLLAPHAAIASNFTVTPTEVDLSASATSALVTLRNGSKLPLRFEVTLFSWSEDEHGKMALTPSSDVTFFPKLVELAGGASRNIRIGINAGMARDVEQSFRLFIEELPDQSAPKANAVALRTKIGIPVFVRPAKPVAVRGDRWRLGRERQGAGARSQHRQPARQRRYHFSQRHWWIGRPHVHEGRTRLVRAARRDANL